MQEHSPLPHSAVGLDRQGLKNLKAAYWNLPTPALYEEALKRNEGIMAHLGPSSCARGSSPDARPTTSSSWRSQAVETGSGGAR